MSQRVLSSWTVCHFPRWDKSEILSDLEGKSENNKPPLDAPPEALRFFSNASQWYAKPRR
jgi:hypothetical protein